MRSLAHDVSVAAVVFVCLSLCGCFPWSGSQELADEELVKAVIGKEREIFTSRDTSLIENVWCDDGVIYNNNETSITADDYVLYSGMEQILGYYIMNLNMFYYPEYHQEIENLAVEDDGAYCTLSGHVTMQTANSGERTYFHYSRWQATLVRRDGYWKIYSMRVSFE